MTSTGSAQNVPAPKPSAPIVASYASAAGASGKTSSSTGPSTAPVVAASSTASKSATPGNARTASVSPLNGSAGSSNPANNTNTMSANASPAAHSGGNSSSTSSSKPVTPAVPAVINGSTADHARNSSVTIVATAPNGYVSNGVAAGAQPKFGFDSESSPAMGHSSPQPNAASQRIPSPAHSPIPIPQPSASGGRPPSITQDGSNMKFGSFGGDGDRHLKHNFSHMPGNLPVGNSSPHFRRGSTHSVHSDIGNPAGRDNHMNHGPGNHGPHHGGPSGRGGYGSGNRGRGGYNNHNNGHNHFNGQSLPFQPQGQYPRGPPSQGPRNSAPSFQPRNVMNPGFGPNSPQTSNSRASPAVPPILPSGSTPQIPGAVPVPGGSPYMSMQYSTPAGFPPQPNVNTAPLSLPSNNASYDHTGRYTGPPSSHIGGSSKKGARGGAKKHAFNNANMSRAFDSDTGYNKGVPHRSSKRWSESEQPREHAEPFSQLGGPGANSHSTATEAPTNVNNPHRPAGDQTGQTGQIGQTASQQPGSGPVPPPPQPHRGAFGNHVDDLSPRSSNFDRLLTTRQQNYPPFQQGYNVMGYPGYQNINPYAAPPPPQQGYQHPYGAQQFVPPAAQPMSRTSSQAASERPNSSMGQVQTPSTAHAALAIPGSVVGSAQKPGTNFVKPKKNAIVIKNPQGETIDFNKKASASPAPIPNPPAVSRTPPAVVSSTPPPPPKSTTPSHGRTDSSAGTQSIADQVRNEFKERVHKRAETPAEAESKAKSEAAAAAAAAAVPKAEEKKSDPVIVSSSPAPAAVVKTEAPAAAAKEAPAPEKKEAPAAAEPNLDDDEEMERMIREMEEEEAKREAEEAAYNAKKKERDAAAKIQAEADRVKNAAENDRLLREQKREMERLEEERERKRKEGDAPKPKTAAETIVEKISNIGNSPDSLASKLGDLKITDGAKSGLSASETAAKRAKPSALNLAPLNTKAVEPPQPSAALQSLKTARFLRDPTAIAYPKGIQSPNPALNPAVNKKGNFKYDMGFLLQFKDVFVEKPSLDFDTQVKSLIGEEGASRSGARTPAGSSSGRQGSRNASSAFNMGAMGGAMGSFNSKPLPAGTTSEQRFAISSGALPRPNAPAGMSFGRPGAGFPGSSSMTRTPSASIGGGMPNSPRQGSRSARGSSRQAPHNAKAEAQAAKTMPLTQGMDLKPIVTTSTGWKPNSIVNRAAAQSAAGPDMMDPEMVQRKVKAALNKMTPEKFDKISDQILNIALQSKDEEDGRTLRQVIQLTFEKATDEAYWASMYARFCKRMLDQMSSEIRDVTIKDKKGDIISGGTLFRKYLLNRCQQEFERGWKVDLPEPKEGETKEMTMLSDEYYQAAGAKRRGLGLVQFIGELYKLGMLTERIMHECVRKLVDYEKTPDEAEIESLSKLLRTVGSNLDRTEKGRPMMDAYFERIKNIIDIPDLASRLKFMLMDIVDLRSRNWVSNEDNKGPKTLQEVRQDVQAQQAQKAVESARTNSQRGPGGRPGGGGRGDPRQFQYNQPVPNQVGIDDLRRLKGGASRIASSGMPTLGPTSMFASRSNSGRRPGFARPGDDSGPASRTGTPPTRQDSNSVSHSNAFEALANVETDTPASPPSTAASPAITKASIDKDAGN